MCRFKIVELWYEGEAISMEILVKIGFECLIQVMIWLKFDTFPKSAKTL